MLGTLQDKLLAGGLAVALGISVVSIFDLKGDLRDERVRVASLDKQINHPVTGYAARLAICKGNQQVLEGGIDRQNASIATTAARGTAAKGRAEASVARAQVGSEKAATQATEIINREPRGATTCERVLDVDAELMESIR